MLARNKYLLFQIASTLLIATTPLQVNAQAKPSLFEQQCDSATPGRDLSGLVDFSNDSATIGREILPIAATVGIIAPLGRTLYPATPVEFVCMLKRSFQKLNLVYGIDRKNQLSNPDAKILLQVYVDGNLAGSKVVTVSPKQQLSVNLQGGKSVAIRAMCQNQICPPISFIEMSVK